MTRLQSSARTANEAIETMAPLLPLIFAALFVRGLPWIIGSIAQ